MDAPDYTTYVARLAHELRHVFLTIEMHAHKAEQRQPSDPDGTYRDISVAARVGLRILERYRFLGVGPESLPLRPHSVRAIRDAVAEVAREFRSARDLIQFDFDSRLDHGGMFLVDLSSFREAVSEVLGNALEFNRRHDTVRIAVAIMPNRDVAIRITNFGDTPGDSFDRWIQPAWRGSNARTAGLGMGLFVASRIASLHNAKLTGDIRDGIVAVTFTLPAYNNQ